MLNSAFVLVLTTVTSITAICKTAVVAQDGSVLILPFLINHMALISARITENIISQMLLLIIALLSVMIVIGLAALDASGFRFLLPTQKRNFSLPNTTIQCWENPSSLQVSKYPN